MGTAFGWLHDHLILGQSVAVDLKKLHDCLGQLIDNPDLRNDFAVNSRRRAEEMFSYSAIARQYSALWSELGQLVSDSENSREPNFDAASYFDLFGHYASLHLDDQFLLKRTDLDRVISDDPYCASGEMRMLKFLDGKLLRDLLNLLNSSGSPLPLGEMVKTEAAKTSLNQDLVRRHILWLIKYGYATPVFPNSNV